MGRHHMQKKLIEDDMVLELHEMQRGSGAFRICLVWLRRGNTMCRTWHGYVPAAGIRCRQSTVAPSPPT